MFIQLLVAISLECNFRANNNRKGYIFMTLTEERRHRRFFIERPILSNW